VRDGPSRSGRFMPTTSRSMNCCRSRPKYVGVADEWDV
jgi:hypothetical protein